MKLSELSVVITRPQAQSRSLKQKLDALGCHTISCPCIQIKALSPQRVRSALTQPLSSYDLICFTSPNSVTHGLTALPELEQLPASTQLAAVGKTTAHALRAQGLHNITVPEVKNDSEGLLAILAQQPLAGMTGLIIKGMGGRELLRIALQQRHCTVTTLDVYQRLLPEHPVLLPDHIDVIMFTSSESAENFITLSATSDQQHLLNCQTLVGHPRIGQKVASLGFKKLPIIAASPADQDMLTALQHWAAT